MDIPGTLAAQSYQNAMIAAKPSPMEPAVQEPGFLQKHATQFVEELQKNEEVVAAGLTGKADTHAVVSAMAATELAVETAVTVRDKVVEAYQEILRMPV